MRLSVSSTRRRGRERRVAGTVALLIAHITHPLTPRPTRPHKRCSPWLSDACGTTPRFANSGAARQAPRKVGSKLLPLPSRSEVGATSVSKHVLSGPFTLGTCPDSRRRRTCSLKTVGLFCRQTLGPTSYCNIGTLPRLTKLMLLRSWHAFFSDCGNIHYETR